LTDKKIPRWARRQSKPWTPFENATPGSPVGDKHVVINSLYQVSIEEHNNWTWLAIIRRDRTAVHDWRDLQRIKNELCGPEREALEIYPAESRLVDTNNQFHLWVLPEGETLPVGYTERDVGDKPFGAHKQRPFKDPPEDLNAKPHDDIRAGLVFPRLPTEEEKAAADG
jgi:hypothetical protein